MRIKVELICQRFPRFYNTLGISLIKESLKKSNEDYFRKLYFYNNKSNKKSKSFSFSFYIRNYEIDKEDFIVKDKVIMYISTPDLELGLNIYNGLINTKQIKYKNYEMTRYKIRLLKEAEILEEEVIFNTLSPICIKDISGKFIDINDTNYLKELNYISNIILENYRGYGLKKELEFENINLKKIIVKEPLREFKKITNKDYQFINSYKGMFKLKGDKEDLNDIYKLGIGHKRNQGMGNIEVVTWR